MAKKTTVTKTTKPVKTGTKSTGAKTVKTVKASADKSAAKSAKKEMDSFIQFDLADEYLVPVTVTEEPVATEYKPVKPAKSGSTKPVAKKTATKTASKTAVKKDTPVTKTVSKENGIVATPSKGTISNAAVPKRAAANTEKEDSFEALPEEIMDDIDLFAENAEENRDDDEDFEVLGVSLPRPEHMSPEEKKEAFKLNAEDCYIVQNGTDEERAAAEARLVARNSGLIHAMARKYAYFSDDIIEYDDLWISSSMGLLRAAKTYNPEIAEFSTYATQWMRQQVTRDLFDTKTSIRIPVHAQEIFSKAYRKYQNLSPAQFHDAVEKDPDFKEKEKETIFLCWDIMHVDSLDRPVGEVDEPDAVLGDFKAADVNIEDDVITAMQGEEIRRLVDMYLNEKQKWVITHRFGLKDNAPWTLEECGQAYPYDGPVTRERIRQIEEKAIKKLRMMFNRHKLEYPEYNERNNMSKLNTPERRAKMEEWDYEERKKAFYKKLEEEKKLREQNAAAGDASETKTETKPLVEEKSKKKSAKTGTVKKETEKSSGTWSVSELMAIRPQDDILIGNEGIITRPKREEPTIKTSKTEDAETDRIILEKELQNAQFMIKYMQNRFDETRGAEKRDAKKGLFHFQKRARKLQREIDQLDKKLKAATATPKVSSSPAKGTSKKASAAKTATKSSTKATGKTSSSAKSAAKKPKEAKSEKKDGEKSPSSNRKRKIYKLPFGSFSREALEGKIETLNEHLEESKKRLEATPTTQKWLEESFIKRIQQKIYMFEDGLRQIDSGAVKPVK